MIKDVNVKASWFGAVGDGLQDDTVPIQAALDYVAAAGGGRVYGVIGDTYKVGAVGQKDFIGSSGEIAVLDYCLDIPSDVRLDLCGATLLLDSANPGVVLSNRNSGVNVDTEIAVQNITIDGGGSALPDSALLFFYGVTGLQIEHVTMRNVTAHAAQFSAIDRGYFANLHAENITGNAWAFGVPFEGSEVTNSHFGYLSATQILAGGTQELQGNSFLGVLHNCDIDTLFADGCAGAHKIYSHSRNVELGKVIFRNGTTNNSGLKVQGDEVHRPQQITVGNVQSTDNYGAGLYLTQCDYISISEYSGAHNGHVDMAAVWIEGENIQVGNLTSVAPAALGLYCRVTADLFQFGNVSVFEAGTNAVDLAGGAGTFQSIQAVRPGNRGLAVYGHSDIFVTVLRVLDPGGLAVGVTPPAVCNIANQYS